MNENNEHIPGCWKCPTCGFELVKSTLYLKSGISGPNDEPFVERCPNDNTFMVPETYKMCCHGLSEMLEKLIPENRELQAKLAAAERDVPITQYLFQDQIEATLPEIDFWTSLDNRSGPFILEEMNHNNQKGATTLCYQSGKLVGFTINCRDEMNGTILICAAIAAKPKE